MVSDEKLHYRMVPALLQSILKERSWGWGWDMSPKGNCPKVYKMPFRVFLRKFIHFGKYRSAWGPWIEDKVFALIKMLIFLMPKSIQIAILVWLLSREKNIKLYSSRSSPRIGLTTNLTRCWQNCLVRWLSDWLSNWFSLLKSEKFDFIKVVWLSHIIIVINRCQSHALN